MATGAGDQVLRSASFNVLQTVNITLGTSALVALGEGISSQRFVWPVGAANLAPAVYGGILLFWTAKLFSENHKNFADFGRGSAYAVFQLFMTCIAFLFLMAASFNVGNLSLSLVWLGSHFGTLVLWLVGLGLYHRFIGRDFDKEKYPFVWLGSSLLNVILVSLAYVLIDDPLAVLAALALVLANCIFDAYRSQTFLGGSA